MAASDYPNGQIPLSELSPVGYNINGDMQYLEPTAARYWTALVIKAASQNVPLNCLEGYRSLAEQQRLYDGWIAHLPGFNSASPPGYSPHGYGKAVDVNQIGGFGSSKHDWLTLNAPAFGYTNTVGRTIDEPWHWVFGTPTITTGQLASQYPTTVATASNYQEETDMTVVLINPGESAPRGGGLLISFAPGQAGHLTSYGPATANKTITGNAADGSGYWKLNFDADPRGSFSDLCQLFLGNAITPTALVAWFRANPGATYRVP